MNKSALLKKIIELLREEEAVLTAAALSAHRAATHEDNKARSKYETLALEASYIAQGQANRALELREAIVEYEFLAPLTFTEQTPIALTALVTYEDAEGRARRVLLGPAAGGLRVPDGGPGVVVVTENAPLAKALVGLVVDDEFEINGREYVVTEVQ